MLDSLKIQNFKNIKDLEIPTLAEVNLITGKNNTGKTTILEALSIWASDMDFRWVADLLKERGELFLYENKQEDKINTLKSYTSLFHNRIVNFDGSNAIFIGQDKDYLKIDLVKYVEERIKSGNDTSLIQYTNIDYIKIDKIDQKLLENKEVLVGLETESNTFGKRILSMQLLDLSNQGITILGQTSKTFQFVRSNFQNEKNNFSLWSNIALSEREDYVIEALKTIENTVEKIAFLTDETTENTYKVIAKIKGSNQRINLKSMGDGINWVLTVILHLVNAENGYCFIDEFENGLHHSTQEKLWEIVFFLSQKLNIQVFATTHSRDCVEGFAEVCNMENYQNKGQLIRLKKDSDNSIKIINYSSNDLRIANENNIEVR